MAYKSTEEVRPQQGRQARLFKMIANQEADFFMIGGSRFGGKALPLTQEVPTPNGFRTIEELEIGDEVIGKDGRPTRVMQLHPINTQDSYLVKFSDGSSQVCSLDHQWNAWRYNRGVKSKGSVLRGEDSQKTVSTETLIKWLDATKTQKIPCHPVIGLCDPVEFNKRDVTVDPYLMGLLLGDGCITEKGNTLITTIDEPIKAYLSSLTSNITIDKKQKTDAVAIRFKGDYLKYLISKLQCYSLYGTNSHTKFIPEDYLLNNIEGRYEILRGLLDTDGGAEDRGRVYFTSVSERLALGVRSLAESLGAACTITTKIGKYKDKQGKVVECSKTYKVYIKHKQPELLFKLERKIAKVKLRRDYTRKIVSITKTGSELMRCISVENEDGLFVTGRNYVLTHNSELASMIDILFATDPLYRSIKFRRSYDEIMGANGLWEKAENQYKLFGATPNKSDKAWTFPSNAKALYRHMFHEGDEESHRGKGYSSVIFDEINQFTWDQIKMLQTCLRSEADMDSFMLGTLNPDPNSWTMKFVDWYLDPATGFPDQDKCGEIRYYVLDDGEVVFGPDEAFFQENYWNIVNPVIDPITEEREYIPPKRFTFFFFNIFDNKIGMQMNKQYLSELNGLPEHERQTQLFGNWFAQPKGHSVFKREFLQGLDPKYPSKLPKKSKCLRAWDKAYREPSEKNRYPDYTASIKMYKCPNGEYYLAGDFDEGLHDDFKKGEDVVYGRFRKNVGTRNEWMLQQATMDGTECTVVIPEEGGAGLGEWEQMRNMFRDEGFTVIGAKTGNKKGGKGLRFSSFAVAAEQGGVHILPETFPNKATLNAFLVELEKFDPDGRSSATIKDDWVDCVSDCFLSLQKQRIIRPFKLPDLSGAKTALSDFRGNTNTTSRR